MNIGSTFPGSGEPGSERTVEAGDRVISSDARARLLELINASWTTQALATAARFRIPERLLKQPMSGHELAAACAADPAAMQRLLRALTTLEVVTERADGRYVLGTLGPALLSEEPGGLGAWAELCGGRLWVAWHRLFDCVSSGRSVRALDGGHNGLAHLDADPETAALFHRAMAGLTRGVAEALAQVLRVDDVRCIVDIGGGTGELLSVLLSRHAALRGVLFDRPHAAEAARDRLRRAGLADRCEVLCGDFFSAVPRAGELYLLKSILHDWDDAAALRILAQCRAAMGRGDRLVVVERLAPHRMSSAPTDRSIARSDLNMLIGPGGQERTERAYHDLLARSGLRVAGVLPLVDQFSLIEAIAHDAVD